MTKKSFGNFQSQKTNAQKKEEFRQEKKKARTEKNEYFAKKKAEENSYRAQDTRIKKKDGPATPAKAQTPAQPVTFKRENTNGEMPLNKYLAHCDVCSRREAAEVIKKGTVVVNGTVITEPGHKVTDKDEVKVNGKKITIQKELIYILLNKPKDYITTSEDPQGRRTIMDLMRGVSTQRIYPVGRLDRNTTGVILLTNDGELTQKLSHPSYQVKKVYEVTLDKNLEKRDFEKLLTGVTLEDVIALGAS